MLGWQNQMVNSANPGCEVLVHGLSWILYHGEILILCWSNHCLCCFYILLVKVMSPFLLGHLSQPLPTKSSSFSVKGEVSFFAMNCEIYLFDHVWSIDSPVPLRKLPSFVGKTATICWQNPQPLLRHHLKKHFDEVSEFETIATWVQGSSVAFDLGIYMVISMGSIVTIGMGFICDLMVICDFDLGIQEPCRKHVRGHPPQNHRFQPPADWKGCEPHKGTNVNDPWEMGRSVTLGGQ